MQVYYKTGYDGVRPDSVQAFPDGLRMIAGSGSSRAPQPGIIEYSCTASDGSRSQVAAVSRPARGRAVHHGDQVPAVLGREEPRHPDHKSHMAYGLGWHFRGCPASHPVPLTQITQHYRYRVPADGMRPGDFERHVRGPAGYTGHADWMNGWEPPHFQRVDNCFHPGLDCELDLLGDGYTLL